MALVTLLASTIGVSLLIHVVPGDPVMMMATHSNGAERRGDARGDRECPARARPRPARVATDAALPISAISFKAISGARSSAPSPAYLDEFVFRFNRRKTRHAAFRSLFRLATNAEPLTYSMLIEPEPCA